MDCCRSCYDRTFTDRYARMLRRRFERRGLPGPARRIVEFLTNQGIEGASVLEIGGGVGDLQIELLRRGAARTTNVELSSSYEQDAARLITAHGLGDRVSRRMVNLVEQPDAAEPADVVVLHRVVCCFPDYQALLGVAADHARRLLVFSHPPDNLLTRSAAGAVNGWERLRREEYRAYVHPPEDMLDVLRGAGLRPVLQQRGIAWWIEGLERIQPATSE
jgi:2-polyprenyl-3-methyl-5-hydroxy-6-metoxy-1,4-benzoquinol methylase